MPERTYKILCFVLFAFCVTVSIVVDYVSLVFDFLMYPAAIFLIFIEPANVFIKSCQQMMQLDIKKY